MEERKEGWTNPSNEGYEPVDADIIRVDLDRLASILGCNLGEIVSGLQNQSISRTEGVELRGGEKAEFQLNQAAPLFSPPRVRQALVTAASRTQQGATPRQLLVLGGATGMTVIEIILYNLVRAGIERAVVVVGRHGQKIMRKVRRSHVNDKLRVDFIDLGDDYSGGFGRSILRARDAFDAPFLLATSDHTFDPTLLHHMAEHDFGDPQAGAACVLVEEDLPMTLRRCLPPTAVHVRRPDPADRGKVAEIGRIGTIAQQDPSAGPETWDGIEAGLFCLTTEVFEQLEELTHKQDYVTLVHALQIYAAQGRLRCKTTSGRPWLDLETKEQQMFSESDLVPQLMGTSDLFPWQCKTVKNPNKASLGRLLAASPVDRSAIAGTAPAVGRPPRGPPGSKSLMIALPTPDQDFTAARAVLETRMGRGLPDFSGFIVPVASYHASEGDEDVEAGTQGIRRIRSHRTMFSQQAAAEAAADAAGAEPVLKKLGSRSRLNSFHGVFVEMQAEEAAAAGAVQPHEHKHGPLAVSIPMQLDGGDKAGTGHEGYIIPVPTDQAKAMSVEEFVFAVPSMPAPDSLESPDRLMYDAADDRGQQGFQRLRSLRTLTHLELPSGIESVKIETDVTKDEGIEVHVVVSKVVPPIGWVILVVALIGSSAAGPMGSVIGRLEPGLNPLYTALWRQTSTMLLYTPFFLWALRDSPTRKQLLNPSVMLPNAISALGTAAWGLCFYSALHFTSVANAALFATTTPIMLVVYKGARGDRVAPLEGAGVAVAMAGAGLCSMDKTGASSAASGGDNNVVGIILALLAACFGGVYVVNAKVVRPMIDVALFVWLGSFIPFLVLTAVMGALSWGNLREALTGEQGLFGWAFNPTVLFAQFLTSIVADACGNFGFFLTLKYVDPLVVSVVCLAIPIVAVLESMAMGVGSIPGPFVMGGAVFIMVGAGMVMAVSMAPHQEDFDVTDAIKQPPPGPEMVVPQTIRDKNTALKEGAGRSQVKEADSTQPVRRTASLEALFRKNSGQNEANGTQPLLNKAGNGYGSTQE